MQFLLILICCHIAIDNSYAQENKNVLFIGNSYIYSNNLPVTLNNLANSFSDTVTHSSSTPGGAQLIQHVGNSNTLNLIRQGNWDFVILQEQSQKPSFPPAQVASDVLPYASILNDSIEYYNACAETVFFMTWGRQNGDQTNCAFYPPLCTYEGMQQRLRESYLLMAEQNNAICAPVGAVWKYVRDSFPSINLYNTDGSHPSFAGTYLAACSFYATLFRKSPVGSGYIGSLSAADALALQNAAAHVVLDSTDNWKIGAYDVVADFDPIFNSSNSVTFQNNSSNADQFIWSFGDSSGQTSSDVSPVHTFDSTGSYTVTLVAMDSCGEIDTISQVINISTTTSLDDLEDFQLDIYPNPTKSILNIASKKMVSSIQLYDLNGRLIYENKTLNAYDHRIDLVNVKKGYCVLKIHIEGIVYSNKLLLN